MTEQTSDVYDVYESVTYASGERCSRSIKVHRDSHVGWLMRQPGTTVTITHTPRPRDHEGIRSEVVEQVYERRG